MELSHRNVVRGSSPLTVATSDLIHQGMESCSCSCYGLHDRHEAFRVDPFDCFGKALYSAMREKKSDAVQKLSQLVKEAG